MAHRIERDTLGEVLVPAEALWGAQTQRAVDNFPISGRPLPPRFIHALAVVKRATTRANRDLGLLPQPLADALLTATDEVLAGEHLDQFPVDVYQTGSGTSTNMNANEVLARRASQLLGEQVHPNDHVNMGQSSNDVIPTALHIAGATAIHQDLLPALRRLGSLLDAKARDFDDVVKSGRTHLMDATPIRLGQVFSGYAAQAHRAVHRAQAARDALRELALGGTAVGTGINRHPHLPRLALSHIREATGLAFVPADNPFEAQGARDGVVEAHGMLHAVSTSLAKVANDVRWLASGPTAGLGEITLPPVQPGSSIMPAKVNPVMAEALLMVCARVAGNQVTIGIGGMRGNFELNTYLPLLADVLLESVDLLANGVRAFAERCVAGIEADEARCTATVELNPSLCTALAPALGYEAAAAIGKEAGATGRTVREVARERGVLPEAELDRLLDVRAMTESR